LTDGFDDGLAEGGNVIGLAAEDELALRDYFLIDPAGSGVFQISLERGPLRYRLALERAGLDQRPGAVADCGDCFSGGDELADEVHRFGVHAQVIGIHHAAGQHQCVIFVGVGVVEQLVDLDSVAPFLGVSALGCSRIVEGFARLGEFDLLEVRWRRSFE
jgi:hypothetical protein